MLTHCRWTLSHAASLFCCPVSGVDCPCPFFHPTAFCCLPLCSPAANCLSLGRVVHCLVRVPRQLSFASPYHFRIRRDFMSKNPLSGFAPKQTRLLWRPTHIVLHKYHLVICSKFDFLHNSQ